MPHTGLSVEPLNSSVKVGVSHFEVSTLLLFTALSEPSFAAVTR